MVRECILYNFNPLKLSDPCIMAQSTVYLGKCSIYTQKESVLAVAGWNVL